MAEASLSSGIMGESDIKAMKETLRAQQQLLQKLYVELDEEREASATAASEALDMILRLQGEKAAVKMEARQYERMAEEKLEHAETTLEIFKELMYQKDMKIASLENHVQAYKRVLVGLGCDPNLTEFELQENYNNDIQLLQRSDEHHQNTENESVRRIQSLPPLPVNKNNFRAARKRERSPSPNHHHQTDMIQTIEEAKTEKKLVQQSVDFAKNSGESTHETLDTYWEQIRKLDEKVKEISDCKEIEGGKDPNLRGRRHRSCSLDRARSKTNSNIASNQVVHHEVKQQQNRERITDPSCSVNVHDVFEVPQPGDDDNRVNKDGKNRLERLGTIDSDNRLTKPDPEFLEEKAEALSRDDSGKLMRFLDINMEAKAQSPNGRNSSNNNEITCIFGRKMEGMSVECNGKAVFHILLKRIERLEKESEIVSPRQEITHRDSEEQLRLLKEILRQLKSMREETMSINSKAKKSPLTDEGLLDRLKEAMLRCWI